MARRNQREFYLAAMGCPACIALQFVYDGLQNKCPQGPAVCGGLNFDSAEDGVR